MASEAKPSSGADWREPVGSPRLARDDEGCEIGESRVRALFCQMVLGRVLFLVMASEAKPSSGGDRHDPLDRRAWLAMTRRLKSAFGLWSEILVK
jgi:hypothetical protein